MSASGIASTLPPAPPRAQQRRDPATSPATHDPDFSRTLQDRAALTDPTGTLASGLGAPTDAAPSAVSFDRGDLFGRAVDLQHQPQGQGFNETAIHQNPVNAAETASDTAGAQRAALSAAPQGSLEHDGAGIVSEFSDLGLPQPIRAFGRPTVGNNLTMTLQPQGEATVEATGESPDYSGPPSAPLKNSKALGRGGGQSASVTSSKHADLRKSAVELLTPVNVIVRSTQAGVQVTARIGGLSTGEDASLASVIAEAAEDEGAHLSEVRVNGREIRRSRECQ